MASKLVQLEERLVRLESEIRELRKSVSEKPVVPWHRRILGDFKNDPVFEEIVRLGKEIRDNEAQSEANPFQTISSQGGVTLRYLLDTDHVSALQQEHQDGTRLAIRLDAIPPDDYATSTVTFHEQMQGWLAYLNRAAESGHVVRAYSYLDRMRKSFERFNVEPFDSAAQSIYEGIRSKCRTVGTLDLRIASIALSIGATLLTRNAADFSKVPGLKFEDWTRF